MSFGGIQNINKFNFFFGVFEGIFIYLCHIKLRLTNFIAILGKTNDAF